MTEKNVTIFIIDDNVPQPQEYVEQEIFNKAIEIANMINLVKNEEWTGEQSLQELLRLVLSHKQVKDGRVVVKGFTHPEICLKHIEHGEKPDIVIYDWEYGSEHNSYSSSWLQEILDLTNAFVFVYSGVRHYIPTHLNKSKFDKYSDRFQLFGKGGKNDSLFSSEEFILQYILNRIQSDNTIMIQGIEINFKSSGYLKEAKDILYLESIFDRAYVLKMLKDGINEESVKTMLDESGGTVLYDKKRGFLISDNSKIIIERFKPSESFTYSQVVLRYGLKVLEDTLKRGLTKI